MKKKLNFFKLFSGFVYLLVILALAVIAGSAALTVFDTQINVKIFTVQSGSMEPNIKIGSVVFVKSQDSYKEGDVITYKTEAERNIKNPQRTTTHRIVSARENDEGLFFETKGDANEAPDISETPLDLVVGKVVFHIPLIGYPVSFAKTKEGFVLLIVVPATIIVYSEVLNIKNEIVKFYKNRKKKKKNVAKD